ncbi:LysR family transcriptional regulator [Devosia yakushimensis]|nr:LysR family transcriptional regulator [Devosia yakushimensis]
MALDQTDLNLLRVFDILMKERSVTGAAIALGRTQSAVSHSLNKLRLLFEDELFTRDGPRMKPTPRAQELAEDVSNSLIGIQATIKRFKTFDPGQTHRNFRIGLSDYDALIFVPGLLRRFSLEAPYATLNIIPTSSSEVRPLISSGDLDCAVISKLEWDDPNLHRIVLGKDALRCVVWRGSRLAQKGLDLDAYLAARHVQISADGVSAGAAEAALREIGQTRRVVATVPSYQLIPQMLRGTELLTHCGESVAMILGGQDEVIFLRPPIPLPDISVTLIMHSQLTLDPATSWLREMIENVFKEWRTQKQKK